MRDPGNEVATSHETMKFDSSSTDVTCSDRAEKRLRMRHWSPSQPISFEIAQSARYLARKYRLEQHIPNERPSSLLTSQ